MPRRKGRPATVATATAAAIAAVGLSAVAASGQHEPAGPAASPAHPFPAHVTYKTGVMPSATSPPATPRSPGSTTRGRSTTWSGARPTSYLSTGDDDAPNNGTVSEAQGYGMNIVPLMAGYDPDAQTEFDGLWHVVKDHRDARA